MRAASWTYVGIAYLLTWTITLTSYFSHRSGLLTLDQLNLLYNLGALGPFVAAFVSARVFYGPRGVKKLLATFRWQGLGKVPLMLALSPLVLFALGWLAYPLFTGKLFTFAETQRQFNLAGPSSYVGWILPFFTYSFFEEFGWRGFLLPHLQERYSALKATFLLTAVWACWHLPFFLWRFQFSPFISVGFFFSIFVGAVILTSIFNGAKGSIVPVILFHLCNNMASALDKEYIVVVVSTGFVFLAVYTLRTYGKENLSAQKKVLNFYINGNG